MNLKMTDYKNNIIIIYRNIIIIKMDELKKMASKVAKQQVEIKRGRGRPKKEKPPQPEGEVKPKKSRGRPKKDKPVEPVETKPKKGRGRPKKEKPVEPVEVKPKKGRGRPKKVKPVPEPKVEEAPMPPPAPVVPVVPEVKPKKGRGRPKKVKPQEVPATPAPTPEPMPEPTPMPKPKAKAKAKAKKQKKGPETKAPEFEQASQTLKVESIPQAEPTGTFKSHEKHEPPKIGTGAGSLKHYNYTDAVGADSLPKNVVGTTPAYVNGVPFSLKPKF
jgi:hypothetical protein